MAFRYTDLGQLVATDPAAAKARLTAALEAHGYNQVEAAVALGVNRDTLGRWLDSLAARGHEVQGRGTAKRGRKPGQKQQAAEPPRGRRRRYADAPSA